MLSAAAAAAAAVLSGATAITSPSQCTKLTHPRNSLKLPCKFPLKTYPHTTNNQNFPKLSLLSVKCSSTSPGLAASDENVPLPLQDQDPPKEDENVGFWNKWKGKSAEMSRKLAKLGLAAVLAYGLLDGVTYTVLFIGVFLTYEKTTGKNPAADFKALIAIVLLMWSGNNVTRPFRVAGAASLAPAVDNMLRRIQKDMNLPSLFYAFAFVAGTFATACLTIIGLVILSKWGK